MLRKILKEKSLITKKAENRLTLYIYIYIYISCSPNLLIRQERTYSKNDLKNNEKTEKTKIIGSKSILCKKIGHYLVYHFVNHRDIKNVMTYSSGVRDGP